MEKITAFAELGSQLSKIIDNKIRSLSEEALVINSLINESIHYNSWFTPENVCFCLSSWAQVLTEKNLSLWTKKYNLSQHKDAKNIGLILAGNIPMVGFHDVLCVLLSGHHFTAKCSSSDDKLLPAVMKLLCHIEPQFSEKISFTNGLLKDSDAFIATGSNNSGRYFDFYFQKYPHIIRRNKNSVAILTGKETKEELHQLGEDIFRYFGLGCRNVSKIFVPENYNFQLLIDAFFEWNFIENHHKYKNNYDYNKAIAMVNGDGFIDSGFFILKSSDTLHSPISVIFYEYYTSIDEVIAKVEKEKNNIQCIVSKISEKDFIPFGQAQHPQLWDYADHIDTMAFLEHC